MTNNLKHMCNGEYTFIYLANSTNKLTQISKRRALGNYTCGWNAKGQPFAPIAPPTYGGSNVQA